MIIKLEKSKKPSKRYMVTLSNGETYDFGLDGGSTYIDHHDQQKRESYWKRHLGNKKEHDLYSNLLASPALFSLVLLWGPSTDLGENVKILNDIWQKKYGGSAKTAGYVRRMEAEGKLLLHKVTNPSKHLQNKYGNIQLPEPEPQPEPVYEQPIFNENENVDFNVGKPKKKTTKNKLPTEAEEERQQAQHRKELEEKQNKIKKLENLKAQLVECRKELGKENTKYMDVLEEVRNRKGMKKDDRTNLEQSVRQKYVKNIDKIKSKYKEVFQFISNNQLNDNNLNAVHKYISDKIKSL